MTWNFIGKAVLTPKFRMAKHVSVWPYKTLLWHEFFDHFRLTHTQMIKIDKAAEYPKIFSKTAGP